MRLTNEPYPGETRDLVNELDGLRQKVGIACGAEHALSQLIDEALGSHDVARMRVASAAVAGLPEEDRRQILGTEDGERTGAERICIRDNNSGVDANCAICGWVFEPRHGVELFIDGACGVVCADCGYKHAPGLAALVDLAHHAQALTWLALPLFAPDFDATQSAELLEQVKSRSMEPPGRPKDCGESCIDSTPPTWTMEQEEPSPCE